MTDPVERGLRDLLDERARGDPLTAQAILDDVAAFPARRPPLTRRVLPIAAALAVVALVVAIAAPRLGGIGNLPPTPTAATLGTGLPAGPEAFAGDPRLAQCSGAIADMEFVFEMEHARDYRRYLPAMGLSPELDVDASALAVVFNAATGQPPTTGLGPGPTNEPGHRYLCVLVDGQGANLYANVDITGLTADVDPTVSSPTPLATDAATPEPTITPPPAPAWAADLAGQLECEGGIASIGGEVPDAFGVGAGGESPDSGLASFLGPGNPFASLPAGGYIQLNVDEHWASYVHRHEDRAKAIIVLTDTNPFGQEPGWLVIGLRACDASEFDPAVPLTFPITIWTDAAGEPVATETIRSSPGPAHCGWDVAIWLNVRGDLYFRDPAGVMGSWTSTPFDPSADLPGAAVDSGYRNGEWSLWLEPGGDAYLVSPDTIERWPRSSEPFIGCV